jgi:hypothetical protein
MTVAGLALMLSTDGMSEAPLSTQEAFGYMMLIGGFPHTLISGVGLIVASIRRPYGYFGLYTDQNHVGIAYNF